MNLGDRMKAYEETFTTVLPPTMPIVVRIDGRAFHTYTSKMNFNKPYDIILRNAMIAGAEELVNDAQNAKLAYIQSDEITLVMVLDRFESQHWFGGVKRKIESISASLVTNGFNRRLMRNLDTRYIEWAVFDARAFSLPFGEVLNNLHWRIVDAERNSIHMLAQSYFSHKELQGVSTKEMQNMLFENYGVNWSHRSPEFKRGHLVLKNGVITGVPRVPENRDWWNKVLFENCVYVGEK